MSCDTLIKRGAFADARAALDRLGADLQGAEERLTGERLQLASSWCQLDTVAKEAQGRAEATIVESEKEATEANAAHESMLAEAGTATKR